MTSVQLHITSSVKFSLSADVGKFRVSGGRDGLSGTRAGVTFAEINGGIKPTADVLVFYILYSLLLPSSHSSAARKQKKEKVQLMRELSVYICC